MGQPYAFLDHLITLQLHTEGCEILKISLFNFFFKFIDFDYHFVNSENLFCYYLLDFSINFLDFNNFSDILSIQTVFPQFS